jgi:hypothetical protein
VGDRVRGGGKSPERVIAFVVCEQVRTACDAGIRILDVVEAVFVGFPDFDPGAGDGGAVGVGDGAFDPAGLVCRAPGDVAADGDSGASATKNGPKTVASVAVVVPA